MIPTGRGWTSGPITLSASWCSMSPRWCAAFIRANSLLPADDPYHFAKQKALPMGTLDDYLAVLERLFGEAKSRGAVCLKTTLAYQRTLRFENVPKDKAARAFGRRRSELTEGQVKDFEDFIMWRLVELSAKHALPFQIHTGQA